MDVNTVNWSGLPQDMWRGILRELPPSTLLKVREVSKLLRVLATEDRLWMQMASACPAYVYEKGQCFANMKKYVEETADLICADGIREIATHSLANFEVRGAVQMGHYIAMWGASANGPPFQKVDRVHLFDLRTKEERLLTVCDGISSLLTSKGTAEEYLIVKGIRDGKRLVTIWSGTELAESSADPLVLQWNFNPHDHIVSANDYLYILKKSGIKSLHIEVYDLRTKQTQPVATLPSEEVGALMAYGDACCFVTLSKVVTNVESYRWDSVSGVLRKIEGDYLSFKSLDEASITWRMNSSYKLCGKVIAAVVDRGFDEKIGNMDAYDYYGAECGELLMKGLSFPFRGGFQTLLLDNLGVLTFDVKESDNAVQLTIERIIIEGPEGGLLFPPFLIHMPKGKPCGTFGRDNLAFLTSGKQLVLLRRDHLRIFEFYSTGDPNLEIRTKVLNVFADTLKTLTRNSLS